MNLPSKVCLGAGVFLVLSGGMLALTGFALGARTSLDLHWDNQGIETDVAYSDSTVGDGAWESSVDPFSRLDVDLSLGSVRVVYGEDYRVSCEGPWTAGLDCESDGDTLRLTGSADGLELGPDGEQAVVTIFLPEGGRLERADLHTGMGQVEMDEVPADRLTVDSDMGDVTLSTVAAEEMDLTLGMGTLTAEGCSTQRSLQVSNSMGDVTLDGSFLGRTECELSMGNLSFTTDGSREDYAWEIDVSMGEFRLDGEVQPGHSERSGGANQLELTNSMGDIEVFFQQ